MDYLEKVAEVLELKGLVNFGFNDKYISAFRREDGAYEASIYDCKTDFINKKEPLDGWIYHGIAINALNSFVENLI